jgi:hypothetical protein
MRKLRLFRTPVFILMCWLAGMMSANAQSKPASTQPTKPPLIPESASLVAAQKAGMPMNAAPASRFASVQRPPSIPVPSPLLTGCGWTAATVISAPIMDAPMVTVGANMYVFGGVSNSAVVATSYKFDGTTWSTIAALPQALEFASAVTDGTDIYILGGANSTGVPQTTIYKYSIAGNSYTTLAPFTTGVWNHSSIYLGGKIYKFGGTGATTSVANLEIYNIGTNTWTAGAALPVAESFMSAFTQGGFIYEAGGLDAVSTIATVKTYRYDPAGNTWDDASIADLPATRWGAATAFYNGAGVLAGGYVAGTATTNISTSAIAWDPASNTWSTITAMTGERARMTGAVLGSSFYVVGGRSVASPNFVGTNDNQKLTCSVATGSSDLSITKTDGVTIYTAGGTLTYTIAVSNAGPDASTGATVADVLPAGIASANWTAVYGGGASGPASGSGSINATVNMPSGSTATFTVVCNVSASASGPISNTATVTPPATIGDPNPGNNTATDIDNSSAGGGCIEKFDGVTAPALPSGWTATANVTCAGSTAWVTQSAVNFSAPNAAFSNDPPCIADEWLNSRTYTVPAAPTQVIFKNNYNTESTYDGMVLEISINGGAFADIITAGGSFVTGGYNATISTAFGSPIAGRQAWSGNSGGFITTAVNLPASAQGQTVVFRWRMASDNSVGITGVYIDDVYIISSATIAYGTGGPICTSSAAITPTITGATGGTFTATPAGLTLNASTGVITPATSTPGAYTVTYTISQGAGCPTFTTTASVTIIAGLNATISYAGNPFCQVAGTATVTQTGSTGGVYSSTAGLTINAATGTITLNTSTPGTYTVNYTLAASGGCSAFTASTQVTIILCNGSGCIETFDGVTVPALPAGWSATTSVTCAGSTAWVTVNTSSSSAPNSAFSNDPPCIADQWLNSKTYAVPAGPTQLVFRNNYNTESTFDGMVLEISINGGAFTDIITAGGTFIGGGYNGTISSSFGNPIGGRQAWTGNSGGFITTTVKLPVAAQGQNVVFRWRMDSDNSVGITGVNIDNVYIVSTATIAYAGSPYCSNGGTVTPTITGTAGGVFTAFPAGLTINSSTGVITLGTSTGGTYTITYTLSGGTNCPATSSTATITVTAAPSATISYAGSPYCSSAGTASITQTGTTGGTYSSTAGLTINASTGAVTLATSTPGTYTVTYTVAAGGGCAVYTTTTTITITAQPSATIAYTGSPYCSSAGTANVTQTGTAGGTYSATPAGLTINAGTGAITLGTSTGGTYTVTYTVAAAGGCSTYTTTASVTVTAQPSATIAYTGSPYCSSAGTATVTRTGTAGGTYTAAPAGLSINASTGTITLGTSTAGTYTVTYTVAAAGGCAVYTTTTSVTITAQPSATITYAGNPFCNGVGTVNVTRTGTAGGVYSAAPAGLVIDPATGAINTNTSTAGTYTVTYTVAAAGGCSVYTTTTSVTINSLSVAPTGATASSTIICGTSGTVNLTVVGGTLGSGASFVWYSGSCDGTLVGTGATLSNILVNGTTTFYVRAEGICNNTTCASVTVNVYPQPTVILTVASGLPNPTATNPSLPSGLFATVSPAGNYTYVWTRNGTVIAANGPSITQANGLFDDFGTYQVTVTGVPSGCTATSNSIAITDIAGDRNHLFISPNPTNGMINIHFYSSTAGAQARMVSVYTASGQRILNKAFAITGIYGNMQLDLSAYPPGTYLVVLMDASNNKIASGGVVKF